MSRRFLVLVLLAASPGPLWALGRVTVDLELDPYYSDVMVTIPFTEGAEEAQVEQGEITTYRDMMVKAFVPRFLALEASVNPLPLVGVGLRAASEDFYNRAQVSPSLNLIEAVTAGFDDPYAFSFFLGKVVDFAPGKRTILRAKKGYVGYLVNVGNYHILDSVLVPDNWIEAEWKIKGDQETEARKMNWSFRGGHKHHGNREIFDTYYLGLRRDRVDYKPARSSFLLNTAIDYRVDFDKESLKAIRHYVMVEKNFPMPRRRWALSVGVGYLHQSGDRYSGSLARQRVRSESQILFRPNVKF